MRIQVLSSVLLLTLACARKEAPPAPAPAPAPLTVTSVTLGKALAAGKRVAQPADTFGPRDTIFASVETAGTADKASLRAHWTFHGAKGPVEVHRHALDLVRVTAPAVHEFHLSKPNNWPKGTYQIEVYVDGASAAKRGFTVR